MRRATPYCFCWPIAPCRLQRRGHPALPGVLVRVRGRAQTDEAWRSPARLAPDESDSAIHLQGEKLRSLAVYPLTVLAAGVLLFAATPAAQPNTGVASRLQSAIGKLMPEDRFPAALVGSWTPEHQSE